MTVESSDSEGNDVNSVDMTFVMISSSFLSVSRAPSAMFCSLFWLLINATQDCSNGPNLGPLQTIKYNFLLLRRRLHVFWELKHLFPVPACSWVSGCPDVQVLQVSRFPERTV